MKFDWSMVKGAQSRFGERPPEPQSRPSAPLMRFPNAGGPPIAADPGATLLDFIAWCVPDDGTNDLGAFGRLYESLEDGQDHPPQAPVYRNSPR